MQQQQFAQDLTFAFAFPDKGWKLMNQVSEDERDKKLQEKLWTRKYLITKYSISLQSWEEQEWYQGVLSSFYAQHKGEKDLGSEKGKNSPVLKNNNM